MMFQTHLVFSLFIGLYLMNYFSEKYLFLGFLLIGSLLPDLDNPYSKLGRKIKSISGLVKFIFGHRGIFHSLVAGFLLFAVFYYVLGFKVIGVGLFAGFALHLVLDGLTRQGVNFLYPFLKFKISGFIRTGGILEWLVFCVLVFFAGLKIVL